MHIVRCLRPPKIIDKILKVSFEFVLNPATFRFLCLLLPQLSAYFLAFNLPVRCRSLLAFFLVYMPGEGMLLEIHVLWSGSPQNTWLHISTPLSTSSFSIFCAACLFQNGSPRIVRSLGGKLAMSHSNTLRSCRILSLLTSVSLVMASSYFLKSWKG